HRTVAPTIGSTFAENAKQELNWELGMGVINVPFAIPNVRIENPEVDAHTRIGWFRSVSNVPHAFAVQSFVAELAAAAGRDQKEFLLDVIGPARWITPATLKDTWNHGEDPERYPVDTGRLRRVVETAAREAGWGKKLPKGRGLGIAAHYSFTTYVAAVVEVAVDDKGALTVPRMDLAGERESGPGARPDAGRVHHGARRRDHRRDHLQGGPRPAGQLQHLRGASDHGRSARDQRPHPAGRLQLAARRGRRAGCAARAP